MNPAIACPACRRLLPEDFFNRPAFAPCPGCGQEVRAEVFPAAARPEAAATMAQPVLVEGEAGCFYHPQKKAVIPCAGCGRFLCALCDCPFDGAHYCPACLELGKSRGKLAKLENSRMRYDRIALWLALLPMLVFYFTLITAPATLYLVFRYWNAPRGLVQRGRTRMVCAGIIAGFQVTAWVIGLVFLLTRNSSH